MEAAAQRAASGGRRLAEVTGLDVTIPTEDWIVYDLDEPLKLKSLTIFGSHCARAGAA